MINFELCEKVVENYDQLIFRYSKPYGFYNTYKLYQKFKETLK